MSLSLIIAGVLVLICWTSSALLFKKFEDKLKGKTWMVGLFGFICYFAFYWLIGYFLNFEILLPVVACTLPWWLNYLYYLNKSKIIKQRITIYEKK